MSEVNEEEQTSAISNSAWDHRKQRSFIIDNQAKRAEEMGVGIVEESELSEGEMGRNELSEEVLSEEETEPVEQYQQMSSRSRGRGGRQVSERENIKPASRGRGAFRGGRGNGKQDEKTVLKESQARNFKSVSEIEKDFSSLSVVQRKGENESSSFSTFSREHENFQSGGKKELGFTYDNMRDMSINDGSNRSESRSANVDLCSNVGQCDTDSEAQSSVTVVESNHGRVSQQSCARAESVISQRDNFLYEESIGEYAESEIQSPTTKSQNLMPSRKKAREQKIALYKEAARISKFQEEFEFQVARTRDKKERLPGGKKSTEIKKEQLKLKEAKLAEEKNEREKESEIETVEPLMSTYRNGGKPFINNSQARQREPRLLPAYQELLNEYTTAVSMVTHVERRREERSHLNKSSQIEDVQKAIEGFKWRLYEEQQTFYQAPTLSYGSAIDLDQFDFKQGTEERTKLYKTEKRFFVDINTVFKTSQQPFRINLKNVGEVDIVFCRKNMNDEEYITFSVDPFSNFTGNTQIGMEIIPNKKYRLKKKSAKQFVFGNENVDPLPMNRIYIDAGFRKYYLEENQSFTAYIYIISCEVYLSPCIRMVRLLQESEANIKKSVKEYMEFVKKPKDYEHKGISDCDSEETLGGYPTSSS